MRAILYSILEHLSISGSVCKGHEVWFKSQLGHLFISCMILGNGLPLGTLVSLCVKWRGVTGGGE